MTDPRQPIAPARRRRARGTSTSCRSCGAAIGYNDQACPEGCTYEAGDSPTFGSFPRR